MANEGFVNGLYADVLGRQPDPQRETKAWTDFMAANPGVTRGQVALYFLRSPEAQAQRTQALYQRILKRPGTPAAVQPLADFVAHGGDPLVVEGQFFATDEYARAHPDGGPAPAPGPGPAPAPTPPVVQGKPGALFTPPPGKLPAHCADQLPRAAAKGI